MPWKTTKLVYLGIPLRRRALYWITLTAAIVLVPTLTWALLVWSTDVGLPQIAIYPGIAFIAFSLMINGWRLILKYNTVLYWEEARFIWPCVALGTIVATVVAWVVARQFASHGYMRTIVPLALGGILLAYILLQWFKIGGLIKRAETSNKSPSRRGSTPPLHPATETAPAGESSED